MNSEDIVSDLDELTLKDVFLKISYWWRFLLSKWIIISICAIIGAAIGLTYSFMSKPIYKAELTFALQGEKSGGGLSSAMGLASQFGLDLNGSGAGGEFSGDNLLELMKSRSIIEKTLLESIIINGKHNTLVEYYIDFNKIRDRWKKDTQLSNIHFLPNSDRRKFTLKQDSILGSFYNALVKSDISVNKVDKKLSIISVSVKSTNELFAKHFAETLVKVVSNFYIQTKTKKAAKNVGVLQKQTDSVRHMLYTAISGVASSIDVNPNPNPLLQTLKVPSQRRQVDVQANTAILNQLVANLEISKMSLLQETPLIQIIDSPILPLEKNKFGKISGVLIGGFFGFFIVTFFLLIKHVFIKIMNQ